MEKTTATPTREKSLLMRGPMVRATLDGRKTTMRQIVNPQPDSSCPIYKRLEMFKGNSVGGIWLSEVDANNDIIPGVTTASTRYARYGPGDRVWVRETWSRVDYVNGYSGPEEAPFVRTVTDDGGHCHCIIYRADVPDFIFDDDSCGKWSPSVHMPRWASRLALEIIDVRAERVQSIHWNETEFEADGIKLPVSELYPDINRGSKLEQQFVKLWNSTHGQDAWYRNDWVWVYGFKTIPIYRDRCSVRRASADSRFVSGLGMAAADIPKPAEQ